ncbi:unnamed protein product [Polarella glacialis]|uniref:BTB domain-containing protein n=1 Tax=Polarella glacialis TaxID=89957 RepID=A0A813F6A4_POLGL|nr:unnamed protein product [Polarella glacialis]
MSPLPWDDHGTPPWEWLPIVSSGLAVLAIAATRACTGQRCRGSFEALDLPHTIWLVWELLVIADPVLGALLLQELLYSRFTGPEPHWDTLSMLMAGSLMCAGAMHVIAFLLYGVLPSLGRQAAGGLLSKVNFSRHLVGHHRYSSAASVVSKRGRNSSKKLSGNGLAAALPPDLDPTEGASAFHFLPLAAIVAVCAASHNDISAVAAAKVGMRVVLLLIGNTVQVACSVLYVTSSWPVAASPGVSVGCWLNTMMIIAGMILVKTRGGFAAGDDTLPLVQASIASSFDLPISAAAPPLVQQAFQAPPQPKTASKGRRPKNDVKKNFDASAESSSAAAESHLRALGRPQVRQTEDPSWRVAPRRGEPPPQLPRRGEAAPQPALVGNDALGSSPPLVTTLDTLPTLGVKNVELEVADLPPLSEAVRNITEGIRGLYQKCQMYDLNLVVGKSRFPAHKAVIASLSRACCERVQEAVVAHQTQLQGPAPVSETPAPAQETSPAGDAPAAVPSEGAAVTSGPENVAPPVAAVAVVVVAAPVSIATGSTRPELHLDFVSNPEAARAFIDFVYGLTEDYNISSAEANQDVLRLAQRLQLPLLEEMATRKLVQDLTTENVMARLSTCKELGLTEMYSAVEQELVENRPALLAVSNSLEVVKQPDILQSILVRCAAAHCPIRENSAVKSNKRALEEPKLGKASDKFTKVSHGRVSAAGA